MTNRQSRRDVLLLGGATGLAASAPWQTQSVLASSPASAQTTSNVEASGSPYTFERGFPTRETVERAYDDADLNRAVQAYRFFYPNVSVYGLLAGFEPLGAKYNQTAVVLESFPRHVLFTPNSDTPYASIPIDVTAGPVAIELPRGPLLGVANDLNFRWIMDVGLPGPDAGKGGKHLILPPNYRGEIPSGFYTGQSTTNRLILIVRSLPMGGDIQGALARLYLVKAYPLNQPDTPFKYVNITQQAVYATPLPWEDNLGFWKILHAIIDSEPPFEPYRNNYGELAVLGIVKGKPFAPDTRMTRILAQAAKIGLAQMKVQSFADRRPDRVAWPDRKWEWAALRPENGTFDMANYADLDAREKWFYQATFESPAMFRRLPGSGSLYWFGARDSSGAYLDGGKTYKLTVPHPVPASLFWSVTVYDPDTRSQIDSGQGNAALRSLFELKPNIERLGSTTGTIDLFFGPSAPAEKAKQWIKTIPGKGWFAYFRIYGPEQEAFDGSWRPGDFEEFKASGGRALQ
jgi:hypothetical protein